MLPVLSLSESLTLSPPSAQRHLSDQDSACGQRPLTLRLRRAVTHYGRHCFPARLDMPGLFAICEGGRRRSLWAWGGNNGQRGHAPLTRGHLTLLRCHHLSLPLLAPVAEVARQPASSPTPAATFPARRRRRLVAHLRWPSTVCLEACSVCAYECVCVCACMYI